ncbi:MAG: TonB family protein [Candidatus Eisenbacteria bacterium]
MRGTLAGSAALHVALLSVLFIVRPAHDVVLPGPDVVQVALIGEPAPPPPPAPVVKANDTVTPDETDGVQIQKARPKPKPEVKQQPKPAEPGPKNPPPAEAAPTTTKRTVLPYAPVAGGLSGQVAVDDANFEFAYYLQMVRAQIARNWTPPAGAATGSRAEVYFRVARSGAISGLRIETGSGNGVFDQSAARAVVITQQLPPLPLGYPGADLGIHFGFEYTGP